MRFDRLILAAFAASLLAAIVSTACSGSGGTSSSVLAHPSPSPSGTAPIGPNLYVANAASPGASIEQFTPTTAPSASPGAPGFSASSAPAVTIADDPNVFSVAADAAYVAESGSSTELGFFNQPLTGSSTVTFTTVPTNDQLIDLRFDSSGNLWGAAFDNNAVLEYSPPFTAASSPALTMTTGLSFPTGLAFDAANDLYVVNAEEPAGTAPEVVEFAPPYTGSPTTTVSLPLALSGAVEAGGAAIWQNELAVGVLEDEGGARPRVKGIPQARPLAVRRPTALLALFNARRHGVRPQEIGTGGEILLYTLPLSSESVPTVTIPDPTAFDVAFDAFGNLYVADPFEDVVQVFTAPFSNASTPAFTIADGIDEPTAVSFGP